MKKLFLIFTTALLLSIIALTVFIKVYITPERVKEFVIPLAEESLNRKVYAGDVDINIFKGISLRDFSIKEPDAVQDFIKCDEFVLKFQFIPLFSGNLIVDELSIRSPSINLVRDNRGHYNFEDIGKKKSDKAHNGSKEEASSDIPISLLINKISFKQVKFVHKDFKKELPDIHSLADVELIISNINGEQLSAEGSISLKIDRAVLRKPVEKELKNLNASLSFAALANLNSNEIEIKKSHLQINNIAISSSGSVKDFNRNPNFDIELKIAKSKIDDILELASNFSDTGGITMSGSIVSGINIKGSYDKIDELLIKGSVNLNQVGIKYNNISTALDGNLIFAFQSESLIIDKADINMDAIPLSLKGRINSLKTSPYIDISLSIAKTKTANLLKMTSSFIDFKEVNASGTISAESTLKGYMNKPELMFADSSIILGDVGISYKEITSSVDGDLRLVYKDGTLDIWKANVKVDKIPLSLKGKINTVLKSPNLDIAFHLPDAETSKLQAMLSPFAKMDGLRLSGRLGADLNVTGPVNKPEHLRAKGLLSLNKLVIIYQDVTAMLDGQVNLDNNSMNIDLHGSSGKNSARFTGSVTSLFKNQSINFDLYSKQLYLDELIPQEKAKPEKHDKVSVADVQKKVTEAAPLNLDMSAQGEIKVDSAVYKGMTMSKFHMKYSFNNNMLDISSMSAKAGKGDFNLTSNIDFSKPGYKYNLTTDIDSLHAEEVVNALFPEAKDTVFGTITANIKLAGKGTQADSLKRNLSANGTFDIKNGKITNSSVSEELALLLSIAELETIKFDKATGTVSVKNGLARLDSIFTSSALKMDPSGTIGLDESLDLAFDMKLSPRLTDKAVTSKVGKYLKDEGGWGSIPVLYKGTLSDPVASIDYEKATKEIGQKVIERQIDKLFKKYLKKDEDSQQQPESPEGQSQDPASPVEDLLKQLPGLFK